MKKIKLNQSAILVIALVLVSIYTVGSTIAWLKDSTSTIKNTFTTTKVDIELEEPEGEKNDYEFIITPGATISKDPKITVKAKSEDSYIFVKIDESDNFSDYLSYEVTDGWTLVDGETNVYYRTYTFSDSDVVYQILKNDQVLASENVTSEQLYNLYDNYPTLSFTAYAVQKNDGSGDFTVLEAWNIAQGLQSDGTLGTGGSN